MHNLNRSRSIEVRPASGATTTGKNEINTANVMRDVLPMPSQTMNSGASAIFGISWNNTMFG